MLVTLHACLVEERTTKCLRKGYSAVHGCQTIYCSVLSIHWSSVQSVFDIPTTEEDDPARSISLALQTLLYKVRTHLYWLTSKCGELARGAGLIVYCMLSHEVADEQPSRCLAFAQSPSKRNPWAPTAHSLLLLVPSCEPHVLCRADAIPAPECFDPGLDPVLRVGPVRGADAGGRP